jgi:hypothetical protein
MPIKIEEHRKWIEEEFIGFRPTFNKVKPVHIANGLFRSITGRLGNTQTLLNFAVSQTAKGEIPKGHNIEEVYKFLSSEKKIETDEVKPENLAQFRQFLRKVVGADGAVFPDTEMQSYTAGFVGFLSKDRIGQDGGELIAFWLQKNRSSLLNCLADTLNDPSDIITTLSLPLLSSEYRDFISTNDIDYQKSRVFNDNQNSSILNIWEGLSESSEILSTHLSNHPNKLFRLRFGVLFACFVLIRHLANLEAMYLPGANDLIPPFLLDFSNDNSSSMSRASQMTYKRTRQSIGRFYEWAFGKSLERFYKLDELSNEKCPVYKKNEAKIETKEIWEVALQEAENSEDPYTIYGRALYDIMAMEANDNPLVYLKNLGNLIGLLYPPNQASQRFTLKEDMIETLLRGVLLAGETVTMSELQNRLWNHYRIIIGGRNEDEVALKKVGIYTIDSKALRDNRDCFAQYLSRLNFARLLADGILQVEAEVTNVHQS